MMSHNPKGQGATSNHIYSAPCKIDFNCVQTVEFNSTLTASRCDGGSCHLL